MWAVLWLSEMGRRYGGWLEKERSLRGCCGWRFMSSGRELFAGEMAHGAQGVVVERNGKIMGKDKRGEGFHGGLWLQCRWGTAEVRT